ncbi:LysR family transcriptional regulator [Bradyrhizobium sp. SK17]|uniref:LysR family transcriptional regulator n=1 Tax=Bradyrhizobium sp. SK17 TaxID=2057741 RepID=UPI000C31B097|nr:LysR family transcriptional regulator [Bradyrhizobium sp. SK17]AUC96682.1 LysR family transcriptional regulator [Bradyrhizobium sp. SK17]
MKTSSSDLASLVVFHAVVKHRSFVGAQVALGLSQSAVSFHIKALEERFGFTLCQRGRRGFGLTDRGSVVFEQSKKIFEELTSFENVVGALKKRLSGTIRLGLVDNTITDPQMPVHRVIAALNRKAPDVIVRIEVRSPESLISELGNGGLDLAILPEPGRYPGIRCIALRQEVHSLYCGSAHPLFGRRRTEIVRETVERHAFVVRPYARMLELEHVPKAIARVSVSSMEAQAILVLSGLYLSYLPEHYAKAWVLRGEMRSLSPSIPRVYSNFFMATRMEKRVPPLLQLAIREFETALRSSGR